MTETKVQEGLRLAREVKAARTPEQVAAAEAAEAQIVSRFLRLFAGTEAQSKSKGHQPCFVLPVEEFREFRKTTPATHRWAEFERELFEIA